MFYRCEYCFGGITGDILVNYFFCYNDIYIYIIEVLSHVDFLVELPCELEGAAKYGKPVFTQYSRIQSLSYPQFRFRLFIFSHNINCPL